MASTRDSHSYAVSYTLEYNRASSDYMLCSVMNAAYESPGYIFFIQRIMP
jgi:hypothetical protein